MEEKPKNSYRFFCNKECQYFPIHCTFWEKSKVTLLPLNLKIRKKIEILRFKFQIRHFTRRKKRKMTPSVDYLNEFL